MNPRKGRGFTLSQRPASRGPGRSGRSWARCASVEPDTSPSLPGRWVVLGSRVLRWVGQWAGPSDGSLVSCGVAAWRLKATAIISGTSCRPQVGQLGVSWSTVNVPPIKRDSTVVYFAAAAPPQAVHGGDSAPYRFLDPCGGES